jgi:hypothetical protein
MAPYTLKIFQGPYRLWGKWLRTLRSCDTYFCPEMTPQSDIGVFPCQMKIIWKKGL